VNESTLEIVAYVYRSVTAVSFKLGSAKRWWKLRNFVCCRNYF